MAETSANIPPPKNQAESNTKINTKKVTRRQFLKLAGISSVSALLAQLIPKNLSAEPINTTPGLVSKIFLPHIQSQNPLITTQKDIASPLSDQVNPELSKSTPEPTPVPEKLADLVKRQKDIISSYKFKSTSSLDPDNPEYGKNESYLDWQLNYFSEHLKDPKTLAQCRKILGQDITAEDMLFWSKPIKSVVLHWTASDTSGPALSEMKDYLANGQADIFHFVIGSDVENNSVLQCLDIGQAPYHVDESDVIHNSGSCIAIECVGSVDGSHRQNPDYLTMEDGSNLSHQQATTCAKLIIALIDEGKINPNDFNLLGHRNIEDTHNVDPGVDFVKKVGDLVRQKYGQITITDS
jgi:hypothetical protein